MVCKIFTASIRIACFLLPFNVKAHVRGFGLLFDTLFDGRLLGVAYLRPAVVTSDFGSGVSVNFGDYVCVGGNSHNHHLPKSKTLTIYFSKPFFKIFSSHFMNVFFYYSSFIHIFYLDKENFIFISSTLF